MPSIIASEDEFQSVMEDVDRELREQKAPSPTRQTKALGILWRRLGMVEPFNLSTLPEAPAFGSYSGSDLALRALNWMKARYGSKLEVQLPGQTMTVIKGDAYRVKLPFAMGRFQVV